MQKCRRSLRVWAVTEVLWSQSALDDLQDIAAYVAGQSSVADAQSLYSRLKACTQHLSRFPRLYEEAPEYGEGVRRISLLGHHVLYEIEEVSQAAVILCVMGQRQQARKIR